jgi:hypothetical protein
MLGADEQERIASEEIQKFNDLAALPSFGRGAVEQAEGQNSLANAEAAPGSPSEAIGKVRTIGSQTFILKDGIWMDTRYDPNLLEVTEIEFLSDQYFDLVRSQPQLAKAFALGTRVIVLSGDTTYEVVANNIENSKIPPKINIQSTATANVHDPVDVETEQSDSSTASLFPCWGGLIVSMLPMIVVGFFRIRRSQDR